MRWSTLTVSVCALLLAACASQAPAVQITNTPIPAAGAQPGNFDVIEIDQATHRLYAADRDRGVDIFDTSTPPATFIDAITLSSAPNGLAIAPDLGRLFAGMANGSVAIIDTNPASATAKTVIKEVPTGGKEADLLDYSAATNQVYVSNGVDGTITAIDAQTGEVKSQIKVGFSLEQPRFNPIDGLLYVTSPDGGALFQIDPASGNVKNKYELSSCQPKGLAIDPRRDRAVIACSTSVVIFDLRSGTVVEAPSQIWGGDVVSYDAKADRFLVGAPNRTPHSAVGILGGNPTAYIATVVIDGGGKSAAYDEANGVVYTPSKSGLAGFRPPAADQLPPSFYPALAALAALVVVALLGVFLIARFGDPIRRLDPEASGN